MAGMAFSSTRTLYGPRYTIARTSASSESGSVRARAGSEPVPVCPARAVPTPCRALRNERPAPIVEPTGHRPGPKGVLAMGSEPAGRPGSVVSADGVPVRYAVHGD